MFLISDCREVKNLLVAKQYGTFTDPFSYPKHLIYVAHISMQWHQYHHQVTKLNIYVQYLTILAVFVVDHMAVSESCSD